MPKYILIYFHLTSSDPHAFPHMTSQMNEKDFCYVSQNSMECFKCNDYSKSKYQKSRWTMNLLAATYVPLESFNMTNTETWQSWWWNMILMNSFHHIIMIARNFFNLGMPIDLTRYLSPSLNSIFLLTWKIIIHNIIKTAKREIWGWGLQKSIQISYWKCKQNSSNHNNSI